MGFKFLPHTADVKILIEEKTLNKAFSTAAMTLREVMAEHVVVDPKVKKEIKVKGKDRESLLYSFLEEFIYLLDAKSFLLSKVSIVRIIKTKDGFSLEAKITGDNAKKYTFTNDVKAITYNDMLIDEKKGKVRIIFVLDV